MVEEWILKKRYEEEMWKQGQLQKEIDELTKKIKKVKQGR
jgi:hypothetical protein